MSLNDIRAVLETSKVRIPLRPCNAIHSVSNQETVACELPDDHDGRHQSRWRTIKVLWP